MRKCFVSLACALAAASLAAQVDCPARIHPGNWSTTLTSVTSGEALIRNFGTFRQSAPTSAQGTAVVDLGTCDGGFGLQMPRMRFEMSQVGGPDSPDYNGEATISSLTYDMDITIIGPGRMVGSFEASTDLGRAGRFVAQASGLTFLFEGAADGPPECVCREKLGEWIGERIDEARRYQEAWADSALRVRPASWPAQSTFLDIWGPQSHRRMVDLVVAGYSPEFAADIIWNNTDTSGNPIGEDLAIAAEQSAPAGDSGGGEGGGDVEYVSSTAAYVDDDCAIQFGDAHESECFPDIALDATTAHETVHVAQCEARQPIGGLNGQANREAEAYAVELEFWESWISENCG